MFSMKLLWLNSSFKNNPVDILDSKDKHNFTGHAKVVPWNNIVLNVYSPWK